MANNTKVARRQAEYKREIYRDNYDTIFTALFHNSVNVKNVSESDLPKRYLLRVLLNKGSIAYDPIRKLYLPFVECGIDQYGLAEEYELVGYKGLVYRLKPNEVIILRANDERRPLKPYIDSQIDKIVDFDMAIEQNLEATKTMTLVEVPDPSTLMTLSNLNESKRIGSSVAFINKQLGLENSVKVYSTGATYIVDKLQEARKQVLDETLNRIGISTANVNKRERVQEAEIQANDSFASDCLNILVDTFNHDAEAGGLDIRLEVNTTMIVETEEDNQNNEIGNDNE